TAPRGRGGPDAGIECAAQRQRTAASRQPLGGSAARRASESGSACDTAGNRGAGGATARAEHFAMMRAATTKAAPTASPASLRPSSGRLLQRKCACADHDGSPQCEECSENKLQRKGAGGSDPRHAPAIVDKVLRAPGAPLDQQARGFMEQRFSHSFGDVRVHTGTEAARSAHAVNARAYTVGRNIVFASGRYAPDTTNGTRLLAHELTHVVQQRSRTPS